MLAACWAIVAQALRYAWQGGLRDADHLSHRRQPQRGGAAETSQSAFRNADFLKIMLNELQNQNPLEPQDTGKLVENMQKLQDLANTTYSKFRNDIRWAQDLVGKSVEVQQVQGTPKEGRDLEEQEPGARRRLSAGERRSHWFPRRR